MDIRLWIGKLLNTYVRDAVLPKTPYPPIILVPMHYVPTGVTVDPAIVHPFAVITLLSFQEAFNKETELHVSKVVAVHIAHPVGHPSTLTDTLLIPQD
jgi:hypothetical protein